MDHVAGGDVRDGVPIEQYRDKHRQEWIWGMPNSPEGSGVVRFNHIDGRIQMRREAAPPAAPACDAVSHSFIGWSEDFGRGYTGWSEDFGRGRGQPRCTHRWRCFSASGRRWSGSQ